MNTFLTESEIRELTKYKHKNLQAIALKDMGIKFFLRRDNSVCVLRSAIEGKSVRIRTEPNFDLMSHVA